MGQHGTAEDFRKNADFQHGIHSDFSGDKHRQHTAQHTAEGIAQPFHYRPCRLFFAQKSQHQREKRRQQTADQHHQPAGSAASLCQFRRQKQGRCPQKIKTEQRLHLPQGNFMVIRKHQRSPLFFMKMDCRFSQGKGRRNRLSSKSR